MDAERIYRLVYVSRSASGDKKDFQQRIADILRVSRSNNLEAGLSGALLFTEGIFAQVLEGPVAQIEETFERIQRDPRHEAVEILAFEEVAVRAFARWSMGFVGRSAEGHAAFDRIAAETAFDLNALSSDKVLALLLRVAQANELS